MSDIEINRMLAEMRAMAAMAGNHNSSPSINGASTENTLDFGELLKQSVDKVNDMQQTASSMSQAFEIGDPNVSLPEVMVALQKASISFQAMLQVRNHLVRAYEDIMNMPI